ncbi:hypothetical protein NEFER03_0575 [Nematocida sp. LUAm3]|nr:hypothetical protein NEFER03_0575 [Nematocida sp. LUAm3]
MFGGSNSKENEDIKEDTSNSAENLKKDQSVKQKEKPIENDTGIEKEIKKRAEEMEEEEEFDETSSPSLENETLSNIYKEKNKHLIEEREKTDNAQINSLPRSVLKTKRTLNELQDNKLDKRDSEEIDKEKDNQLEKLSNSGAPDDIFFDPAMMHDPKSIENMFIWDGESDTKTRSSLDRITEEIFSNNAKTQRRIRIIGFLIIGILLIVGSYFLVSFVMDLNDNAHNISHESIPQNTSTQGL